MPTKSRNSAGLASREDIEARWNQVREAIQDVCWTTCVVRPLPRCDKALPSYLVLIPRAVYPLPLCRALGECQGCRQLPVALLASGCALGGRPDNLLDGLIKKIDELKEFNLNEMPSALIRSQGRSLELTEDRLWTPRLPVRIPSPPVQPLVSATSTIRPPVLPTGPTSGGSHGSPSSAAEGDQRGESRNRANGDEVSKRRPRSDCQLHAAYA